ncbi:hypothetical protein OPKNFCMD_6837 [Methylobacterium crusticola]|uniref:Uncharacterized protein n=1 Tax=Methylobacterium crusticola TaxID=1697972 RepID=A0ABQ4R9N9_9HYPH|nr:hypothetical protein OPKNFCMD_6837 [Methylobacterium crusticola]
MVARPAIHLMGDRAPKADARGYLARQTTRISPHHNSNSRRARAPATGQRRGRKGHRGAGVVRVGRSRSGTRARPAASLPWSPSRRSAARRCTRERAPATGQRRGEKRHRGTWRCGPDLAWSRSGSGPRGASPHWDAGSAPQPRTERHRGRAVRPYRLRRWPRVVGRVEIHLGGSKVRGGQRASTAPGLCRRSFAPGRNRVRKPSSHTVPAFARARDDQHCRRLFKDFGGSRAMARFVTWPAQNLWRLTRARPV